MIGQAAIGNPRIFTPHLPTLQEKLETVLRHLDLSVACDQGSSKPYGKSICLQKEELQQRIQTHLQQPDFETQSIVEFRKFLFQYVKGIPESREWKTGILTVKTYGELRESIKSFFEKRR
jgi:tRNA-dihydrouridine synthase